MTRLFSVFSRCFAAVHDGDTRVTIEPLTARRPSVRTHKRTTAERIFACFQFLYLTLEISAFFLHYFTYNIILFLLLWICRVFFLVIYIFVFGCFI